MTLLYYAVSRLSHSKHTWASSYCCHTCDRTRFIGADLDRGDNADGFWVTHSSRKDRRIENTMLQGHGFLSLQMDENRLGRARDLGYASHTVPLFLLTHTTTAKNPRRPSCMAQYEPSLEQKVTTMLGSSDTQAHRSVIVEFASLIKLGTGGDKRY